MIIFLFGQNSYQSRQKLKEIIGRYQTKYQSGLNLIKINAADFNLADFQDKLLSVSMFAEKKLVVCFDFLTDLAVVSQEKLQEFLKSNKVAKKENAILVFYEAGLPAKQNKLAKFLQVRSQQWQNFELLKSQALETWIKEEFKQQGLEINAVAIRYLKDNIGPDLWRLRQEVDKLAAYKTSATTTDPVCHSRSVCHPCENGNPHIITEQDVALFIAPQYESDIFKTIEALGQQDKKTALRLALRQLDNGADPLYLLSMFVYQWRNLLQLKDLLAWRIPYNLLAKKAGLHPFVVRKAVNQVDVFSLERLKKSYQCWQNTELVVKGGAVDAKQALISAILTI